VNMKVSMDIGTRCRVNIRLLTASYGFLRLFRKKPGKKLASDSCLVSQVHRGKFLFTSVSFLLGFFLKSLVPVSVLGCDQ
jgi:hypothetical protein